MKTISAKSLLQSIPIDKLKRGKYQPREHFEPEMLQELAASLKSAGLLQPIIVRPLPDDDYYEIIAGERRWRAAQLACWESIDCLVNDYSDEQAAEAAAIENINRVNLDPIEEAKAYARLIQSFDYTHEEVAATVGKSRVKITNALRLLSLDETIQNWLAQGQLTEGHGKILAGLSPVLQMRLAQQAVDNGWSTRQLEQAIKKARKQTQPSVQNPNLKALERSLSDHIGCNVSINFEQGKGELKIDFHNLEILDGLFKKMQFQA